MTTRNDCPHGPRAALCPVPAQRVPAAGARQRAYLELAALASSASQARRHVRDALARWGLSHVADDAELIASELVTNAITASAALPFRAAVGLLVAAQPGRVFVMVWDASHKRPVLPGQSDDAVTGRGLAIVAAMSASWGWVPDARGKVVWAVVDLEDPAEQQAPQAS